MNVPYFTVRKDAERIRNRKKNANFSGGSESNKLLRVRAYLNCLNEGIVFNGLIFLFTIHMHPSIEKIVKVGSNHSVLPKPLFWFRSDIETETQIGQSFLPIP